MFNGFTPEAIDFLWGIRMNNNRDWFLPHKQDYVRYLYEPMKALGADLFQPYLDRSGTILKVSRIYRDTRLKPATPYKESLWICIRPDGQWWSENPCLFFQIMPEGVSYGLLWWRPSPAAMTAFRREITRKPEEFLSLLKKAEQDTGIPLTANLYKRPKPCEDDRLAPFYAWKDSICCIREEPVSEAIFTPALEERVKELLRQLDPLYTWLCQFTNE